mmetsp:Transcript_39670/g.79289  ORF Transcript_39670/g.79289 Transcript_39670/m.79289 type:complete len:218 (+) Transcript_39670:223-876(+)
MSPQDTRDDRRRCTLPWRRDGAVHAMRFLIEAERMEELRRLVNDRRAIDGLLHRITRHREHRQPAMLNLGEWHIRSFALHVQWVPLEIAGSVPSWNEAVGVVERLELEHGRGESHQKNEDALGSFKEMAAEKRWRTAVSQHRRRKSKQFGDRSIEELRERPACGREHCQARVLHLSLAHPHNFPLLLVLCRHRHAHSPARPAPCVIIDTQIRRRERH